MKTFEQVWAEMKAQGYQYGDDALDQVRLGWNLALEVLAVELLQAATVALSLEAGGGSGGGGRGSDVGPTAVPIPDDLTGPTGIAGGPGPVGPTMSREWCKTWLGVDPYEGEPDDSPAATQPRDKVKK